jgi:serine/threonine-protein kinase
MKLLFLDAVDDAGVERFRREAEAAKTLQHPNTVRLLDFDLESAEMPFIVYELLRGEALNALLKRERPLTEARVVRLAQQVLKSLMESHACGIVHRDIKPANLFICTYAGESDFVKVLDFGIAKSVLPDSVDLTNAGMLIGTPRYMAPEQIRGESPTPAMDLYAVGMIMAEMIAGDPLIRGSEAHACLEQLSPSPIALPPAVLASRLAPIIRRALEKDASRRYPLASHMLSDIERAMAAPQVAMAEIEPDLESTLDAPLRPEDVAVARARAEAAQYARAGGAHPPAAHPSAPPPAHPPAAHPSAPPPGHPAAHPSAPPPAPYAPAQQAAYGPPPGPMAALAPAYGVPPQIGSTPAYGSAPPPARSQARLIGILVAAGMLLVIVFAVALYVLRIRGIV